MEYLVTMTTTVPPGTAEADVDAIRTREAARSGVLAAEGYLMRLWRPPLAPGEWRTLGLFSADDDAELEEVLASMPLRVWRSDDVTPLRPHANDPDQQADVPAPPAVGADGGEFLSEFSVSVPAGTANETVDDTNAREASRARDLAAEGHLRRLWRLPGPDHALGLWRAHDSDEMEAVLASLPLAAWMTVQTTPLTPHPSDPAA
ncbi:MAG TPA: muconolactone Delta-isomerase family protein [Streptosporangiaceae bacterium]|jgi:muconolactone delta-isomerase